ncbi:MAG: response regulator [Lachnospiraceae bacterium]|nr:response regulator [Butyrivibrio sp.]MCM1342758.1 response regulator [Muribaculaceae bacterium]MCM1409978.1 response regulator [Lachnospiraceae bacterium]
MDMKRILLVGKFNTTVQNLNRILGKEYQMQLASDNLEVVIGMLKMEEPDLILISTGGMEEYHRDIFAHIQANLSYIPVVYVGTEEELRIFKDFEESEQFQAIARPVQMRDISWAISQKLSGITESEEEAEERAPWEKKRIFIIDDSGIQRNMLQNLLKSKYEVMTAGSGMEALRMMRKWLPDLILLDYDMPDHDGKEIFTMLQKEKRYCEIPVVFLTGVKEKEKIQAVLGLVPAGYLLKPVEQGRLMELLENLVGNS